MGAARIVAEELAAALGREIIGFEPVLANQHRIERTATDIRDEAREVPRNLRIGRTISVLGLGDSASLAQPIDLDDIARDAAVGRLPDETGRKAAGQRQTAARHQSPRSAENTSEHQSPMRSTNAVIC